MKRIQTNFFYTLILTLFITCFSTQNQVLAEPCVHSVHLSGTIQNHKDLRLEIIVDQQYLGIEADTLEATFSGTKYDFTIELGRETQVVDLRYGKNILPIYFEQGDDLQLDFEAEKPLETAKFSGTGSEHNNFLADFNRQFATAFDAEAAKKKILTETLDPFEMYLFKTRKEQLAFWKDYDGKSDFSTDFKKFIKNRIKYYYFSNLLGHPIIRGNNNPKVLVVGRIPSVMLDELDDATVNNKDAMIDAYYRSFLVYYTTYFTSKDNGFNKFKSYDNSLASKYKYAAEDLKGEPFSYLVSYFLNRFAGKVSEQTTSLMRKGLALKGKKDYIKLLEDNWEAIVAKTQSKGDRIANASPYLMQDADGKELKLTDFAGKVVYIDFWATWCGPCRKQFPFAKELKKELTEQQLKEVVFLYISLDNTTDGWQQSIKKMGIEGTHAISPGGWSSKAAKHFKISSIPRYMLMDKKGMVVDLNAKRPQQKDELLEDILKLL